MEGQKDEDTRKKEKMAKKGATKFGLENLARKINKNC